MGGAVFLTLQYLDDLRQLQTVIFLRVVLEVNCVFALCKIMENQKILSKRGNEKHYADGHMYVFEKNSTCRTKKFWRCDQKSNGCKARIHTRGGSVIWKLNEHNHDSSAAKVEAQKVITVIKKRAAETMESTAAVINNSIGELSQGAQAILPRMRSLKKMIRRERNQLQAFPVAPRSLEELEIPREFQIYEYGNGHQDTFLLADSGRSSSRILLFGRKNNLKVNI